MAATSASQFPGPSRGAHPSSLRRNAGKNLLAGVSVPPLPLVKSINEALYPGRIVELYVQLTSCTPVEGCVKLRELKASFELLNQ